MVKQTFMEHKIEDCISILRSLEKENEYTEAEDAMYRKKMHARLKELEQQVKDYMLMFKIMRKENKALKSVDKLKVDKLKVDKLKVDKSISDKRSRSLYQKKEVPKKKQIVLVEERKEKVDELEVGKIVGNLVKEMVEKVCEKDTKKREKVVEKKKEEAVVKAEETVEAVEEAEEEVEEEEEEVEAVEGETEEEIEEEEAEEEVEAVEEEAVEGPIEVEDVEEADEDAEEEVYMININGKEYYVNNTENGPIYAVAEDGDIGDIVGKYKASVASFTK